jgi:protein phosphatase
VGDLQGHFHDLVRILQIFHAPSRASAVQYLFLGNIVGRGEFGLQTATLVYLLKAVYPDRVFIIRGSHEFEIPCGSNGFLAELAAEFPDARLVFDHFLSAFAYTPLAAMVDSVTVCVHSGIGPTVRSIETVREVRRPIVDGAMAVAKELLWSNPSPLHQEFAESPRTGMSFGQKAMLRFLQQSAAVRIIRAHEVPPMGFESRFDDRLVTVFSASNYTGRQGNHGAVMLLNRDGEDRIKALPPMRRPLGKITGDECPERKRRNSSKDVPRGPFLRAGIKTSASLAGNRYKQELPAVRASGWVEKEAAARA